jgi:hypothetical protein
LERWAGILYIPNNVPKENAMVYKMMPNPDSEEFEDWVSEAYDGYKNSKPSVVQNERIRPEGQDIFEWLMEDKELIYKTDRDLKKAGLWW